MSCWRVILESSNALTYVCQDEFDADGDRDDVLAHPKPTHWDVGDLSLCHSGWKGRLARRGDEDARLSGVACPFKDVEERFGLAEGEGRKL